MVDWFVVVYIIFNFWKYNGDELFFKANSNGIFIGEGTIYKNRGMWSIALKIVSKLRETGFDEFEDQEEKGWPSKNM